MNIGAWLARSAQATPERPALFLGREQVADYQQFHDQAARVAGWLLAQGVGPGDRVALFMRNCPEVLIAQYAVWYTGAAVVPINNKLHGREAAWIIENAGAKACFATSDLYPAVRDAGAGGHLIDVGAGQFLAALAHEPVAAPAARAPQDLAWLFYTSGTTGRPKGVMITHRMLIAMSLSYLADADEVRADDAILYAAPMSHGAGIYNMMHVRAGARHVCPVSGAFDEVEIFDLARHFGNIHMFAAPTMVKRMTQVAKARGETGQGLRSVVYAGGPMYLADIVEAVDHFGPVFLQIYGQGECPMCITALNHAEVADREHPRWRERLASVGRAQSIVEVQIGDANAQLLVFIEN